MNSLYLVLLSFLLITPTNESDRNNCKVSVNPMVFFIEGCGDMVMQRKIFKIETDCKLAYSRVLIFNRWGDLIFEEKNTNKGFDGTNKGKRVPEGTYFYHIAYQIKNEPDTLIMQGYLQIYH